MKKVYVRRTASGGESASAALVAVGLGALVAGVSFYLTKAFLARDVLRLSAEADAPSDDDEEGAWSP